MKNIFKYHFIVLVYTSTNDIWLINIFIRNIILIKSLNQIINFEKTKFTWIKLNST